jgi:hypothetical protein
MGNESHRLRSREVRLENDAEVVVTVDIARAVFDVRRQRTDGEHVRLPLLHPVNLLEADEERQRVVVRTRSLPTEELDDGRQQRLCSSDMRTNDESAGRAPTLHEFVLGSAVPEQQRAVVVRAEGQRLVPSEIVRKGEDLQRIVSPYFP